MQIYGFGLVVSACALLPTGASAQAAHEFSIDAGHSEVEFEIPFLYGRVKGRFDQVRGTILLGDGRAGAVPGASTVAVVISTASLSTGSAHRDEHLKSDDFFDVARFPVITFQGRVKPGSGGQVAVTGPLTMHGVTREITIPFTMTRSPTDDPHSMTVVGFTARLTLARKDFGVLGGDKHNDWFDKLRSATMGDSVRISLEVHGWAPDPLHPNADLAVLLRQVDSLGMPPVLERLQARKARDSAAFVGAWYDIDLLGRALLARGKTKDGMALLVMVARLLPASPAALVSAGVAHEATGDEAGAITWYRNALAVDSLNPRATARLLRLTPSGR